MPLTDRHRIIGKVARKHVAFWTKTMSVYSIILVSIIFIFPEVSTAALYWCPGTAGGEVTIEPRAGCEPVTEPEAKINEQTQPPRKPIAREQLMVAVDDFQQRYRSFLSCCATDVDSIEEMDELIEDSSRLLAGLERHMPANKLLQTAGRGMVEELAQARRRLRDLKSRLEELGEVLNRIPQLGYQEEALERRRLDEDTESIEQEFRSSAPPSTAPTGPSIGVTPPALGSSPSALPSRSGEDLGTSVPYGPEIGTQGETDLPSETETRKGPDIGTTTYSGPAIGAESSLNH